MFCYESLQYCKISYNIEGTVNIEILLLNITPALISKNPNKIGSLATKKKVFHD